MSKTISELAKEAIDIQDACNLSGVVHSFSRSITRLREIFPNEGTDFFNHHPIAIMFSSKIQSLTNSDVEFSEAYSNCQELSK